MPRIISYKNVIIIETLSACVATIEYLQSTSPTKKFKKKKQKKKYKDHILILPFHLTPQQLLTLTLKSFYPEIKKKLKNQNAIYIELPSSIQWNWKMFGLFQWRWWKRKTTKQTFRHYVVSQGAVCVPFYHHH